MARVISRSGPSKKACYLRFMNETTRKVDIVWIDFHGDSRNYGTLEPGRYFDIHTYEGHPWISQDSVSKRRLKLNKLDIYYPKPPQTVRASPWASNRTPSTSSRKEKKGDGAIKRECVTISLPVIPLKALSSDAVILSVKNREGIKTLDLPKRLEEDLWKSYFPH